MSLDLGELSGQITFDYTPMQRALLAARREIDQWSRTAWDPLPAGARQAAAQAAGQVDAQLAGAQASAEGHGDGVAKKFADGLRKGATGVVTAAVALGTAAGAGIVEAASREVDTDRLGAVLGGGERQMAKYGETAGRIYANNFGDSFVDVTAAVEAVATTVDGIGRGKGLQDLTEQALNFSDVLGLEVPRSVQIAQQLVTTGLVDSVAEGFDLMLAGSRRVPLALREDLMDALDEYGPFFAALGLTGEQAVTSLVNGADQGMYGLDKTGDALKEFTIRGTDMSTASVAAYKAVGLNARDMADDLLAGGKRARGAVDDVARGLLSVESPSKRANLAIALFGTPVEDIGVNKIPGFLRALRDGESQLGNWEGANKRAGEALNDNAARDFGAWKRTLQTEFIDFIEAEVMPTVDDWMSKMADDAGPTVESFGRLWERIGPVIGDVASWLADDVIPGIVDAAGTMYDAFSDFFDDLSTIADEHPELAEMAGMLVEGFGWLVENIFPAVAWWVEHYLPLMADGIGVAADVVEQLAIGFTYVAEYGAEAAQTVLAAFEFVFGNLLQFAENTFGWIFDMLGMEDPIDEALVNFDNFSKGADDVLEDIADGARLLRGQLEHEITPDINEGPAMASITRLLSAADGLAAALDPSKPKGGGTSSAPPTDLEGLLSGADPKGGRRVRTPGARQPTPRELDDADDESPRGSRRGGSDGRPVAAVNVEKLVAHDYDDFLRQRDRVVHMAGGDGVRRPR